MISLLLHQWSGKEPRKEIPASLFLCLNVLSTKPYLHAWIQAGDGKKKNSKRAGRVWKKQLIFSFHSRKRNNGIDSFGELKLENSEHWHWQLNSVPTLCLPLATGQKLPHKTWSGAQGRGAELWKTTPSDTHLNSCILLFLIHGERNHLGMLITQDLQSILQKCYNLISNLPSWTNQGHFSFISLF